MEFYHLNVYGCTGNIRIQTAAHLSPRQPYPLKETKTNNGFVSPKYLSAYPAIFAFKQLHLTQITTYTHAGKIRTQGIVHVGESRVIQHVSKTIARG